MPRRRKNWENNPKPRATTKTLLWEFRISLGGAWKSKSNFLFLTIHWTTDSDMPHVRNPSKDVPSVNVVRCLLDRLSWVLVPTLLPETYKCRNNLNILSRHRKPDLPSVEFQNGKSQTECFIFSFIFSVWRREMCHRRIFRDDRSPVVASLTVLRRN